MIHQHFTKSFSIASRVKKKAAYLYADQGNEADWCLCLLQHSCFGIGEVDFAQVFILLRYEDVT